MLIEQAAQTDGVQSYATLLGPYVWSDVELTARVAIHMTIQARDSQAGLRGLSIVGRVEFFLREWRHQQTQAIELHGCQDVFEQAVIVVDRDHFASGDVAELGPGL